MFQPAEMPHKFSQYWISVSNALFTVAFMMLMLIRRDQRAVKSPYPPI
ncbi:MAG: hypothetical protein ABSA02_27885 [Trebonia sp.]